MSNPPASPYGSWRGPAHTWHHRREVQPGRSGPRVDQFEIVAELGRGGMGVVYKAWDLQSDRFVALKVNRHVRPIREGREDDFAARSPEILGRDQTSADVFLQEILAVGRPAP